MVGGGNNVQKNMNYSRDRELLSTSLPILDFNLRNISQVLAATHKVRYLNHKDWFWYQNGLTKFDSTILTYHEPHYRITCFLEWMLAIFQECNTIFESFH